MSFIKRRAAYTKNFERHYARQWPIANRLPSSRTRFPADAFSRSSNIQPDTSTSIFQSFHASSLSRESEKACPAYRYTAYHSLSAEHHPTATERHRHLIYP